VVATFLTSEITGSSSIASFRIKLVMIKIHIINKLLIGSMKTVNYRMMFLSTHYLLYLVIHVTMYSINYTSCLASVGTLSL